MAKPILVVRVYQVDRKRANEITKTVHDWMNRYAKEVAEQAFKAGRISDNTSFEQWCQTFLTNN